MKKFITIILLLHSFSVSHAQFFEITIEDTSGYINHSTHSLVLAGYLKNLTGNPLHVKMVRIENNLPSSSWTSSLCLRYCANPTIDSISTNDVGGAIPVGDSILVEVVYSQTDSVPSTATVLVKFATMDDSQVQYQWFEASSMISGVGDKDNNSISKFKLFNNYPNPFNNQTIISAQVEKSSNVNLQIFDVLGREIFSTNREISSAGKVTFKWNGLNKHGEELSSGIYFYRVTANSQGSINQSQIKKLTLLR